MERVQQKIDKLDQEYNKRKQEQIEMQMKQDKERVRAELSTQYEAQNSYKYLINMKDQKEKENDKQLMINAYNKDQDIQYVQDQNKMVKKQYLAEELSAQMANRLLNARTEHKQVLAE